MIIICGASASGKTQVAHYLEKEHGFLKVVTCTTRPKRIHEVDGVDYHFYSKDEFISRINNNEFLETTIYNNYYYGTKIDDIKINSVIVLDTIGVNKLYEIYKGSTKIFFLDTNVDIRINRMIQRGDKAEDINNRIRNDEILFNKENIKHIDCIIDSSNKTTASIASTIISIYNQK